MANTGIPKAITRIISDHPTTTRAATISLATLKTIIRAGSANPTTAILRRVLTQALMAREVTINMVPPKPDIISPATPKVGWAIMGEDTAKELTPDRVGETCPPTRAGARTTILGVLQETVVGMEGAVTNGE